MPIPVWLMLAIAIASVIAIFLTTERGRRLADRLGVSERWISRAVPSEDREFLLRACGGDREELTRRIESERERFPEFDEARLYRRAIRREMASPSRDPH